MKIVFDPQCIEYSAPGHPDSPDRIERAVEYLNSTRELIRPAPATAEQILLIHTEEHLRSVEDVSFFEPDCPPIPNIGAYAKLSAGAAIKAAEIGGFSLMRPPGHHAGRAHVAGFCYFNNMAIAVKASGKRTLILDIDGHHGDGTEEIFLGDPQVDFISIHSAPNYPGTGLVSRANCHNYPLSIRCGEEVFLETLETALCAIELDRVEQIGISAGFDTFEADPLASLGLKTESYFKIGKRIGQLQLPTFAILEGGYFALALGRNIDQFLQGLESQLGTPV